MPSSLYPFVILIAVCAAATPAAAFPQFQKQFVNAYAADSGSDYATAVKDAKCFVCHQGKSKKNRNPYGEALSAYIGKPDRKDVDKIVAALETVAAASSDPATEGAPTFGEIIASGALPGGPLDVVKAEPDE